MAQSKATTVEAYLAELPEDRRAVVSAVREAVLKHLPDGYDETINWGMISYEIPLHDYPDTYNGQPLGLVAIAAQKNYYSLYLTCVYQDPEQEVMLKQGFADAGKKLDMGKSCIRFRKLEDLALDVIGKIIAGCPPPKLIQCYETSRSRRKS